MNNDRYVVVYCNNIIGTFNNYLYAIEFLETCKKDNFYLQKKEFSIHIKIDL